jgi:chitin-binding protein
MDSSIKYFWSIVSERSFIVLGAILMLWPNISDGHGTVISPASRVYRIFQEGPDSARSPSTVAALAVAGSNQYYTWNQISQNVPNYAAAAFNDSYAAVILDGQLASGGNIGKSGLDFSGLDLASDAWHWPATPVVAGPLEINWFATATHDPSYFKVWITKDDYDHRSPLIWDKMEYLGQVPHTKSGKDYTLPVILPARMGRHVLYVAWQRIDPVGEVFFSTSDIIFSNDPVDPDADPVVSIESATVNEGDGTATVNLSLSKEVPVGSTARVSYATSDVTAEAGSDYTPAVGTVEFAAGEDRGILTIPITNDTVMEEREVFSISLTKPVDLSIGVPLARVTVEDDDSKGGGSTEWELRDDWDSGFNGWVTLKNNRNQPLKAPVLTFSFPDDERTVVVWGGPNLAELGGGSYRVTGLRSIPAGESIRIDLGVQNTYTEAKRGPENIRLNGLLVGALQPKMFLSRGELRFESFEGFSYQMQRSVDLQKWEDSGEPIEGTGGEMGISHFPNAEKQRQFYRVKLLQ